MKVIFTTGLLLVATHTAWAGGGAHARTTLQGVRGASSMDEARCLDEHQLPRAQQVADRLGTAVDNYIGYGISAATLNHFPADNRGALAELLRTRKGAATCTPLCVVVPAQEPVDWKMCIQDDKGEVCRLGDGVYYEREAAVRGFSMGFSSTGISQLICATGKNWASGGQKRYSLRATW